MHELPPRQAQIAGLVAIGLTEAEIGRRLGITRNTVKNHKTIVYRKLGVRNAVELTLALREAPA